MEAFMYRFHPRTERVLALAASGQLGDIRLVRAAFTFRAFDHTANCFRPELGGGALYDVGCYAVNICRAVLGEPEDAAAFGRIGPSGVDEVAVGTLRFSDGRLGLIDCALTLPRRQEYEVVGTEGTLTVPSPNAFVAGAADAEIHLIRGTDRQVFTIPGTDQYQCMVEHFGDVLSGRPLALPPEDAVANVRVLETLTVSLRRGASNTPGR